MFDLLACCSKSTAGEADVTRAKAMVFAKVEPDVRPSLNGQIDANQVTAWRHIRHLPGEKGWEGEFERFDLGFKPLEEIWPKHPSKISRKN